MITLNRLAAAAVLAVLCLAPASANWRDFAFTYDWWTPARGENEIESYQTWNTRSHNLDGALEFERGITDRFSLGLYGLYAKDRGEPLKTEGYSVEGRYRFLNYASNRILPAAYLEYEKEAGEAAEVEAKAILSWYGGDEAMTNVSLNLITARARETGAPRQYGYALGYARDVAPRLRAGLEATGSLQHREHALGPVVAWRAAPSVRAILSGNFALTSGADTRIRLLVEHEWF